MNCERELRLLRDTLRKRRIPTAVVSSIDPISVVFDPSVGDLILKKQVENLSVAECFGELASNTMYKFVDVVKLNYIFLKLSVLPDGPILFIGPYLSKALSSEDLLELGESIGLSPKDQKNLERFYYGIPVVSEGDSCFVLLDTFCEHIWGVSSFSISNVNAHDISSGPLMHASVASDSFDDTMLNVKAMEVRYKFENEMMRAVALGQIHKEKLMMESFSPQMFEKRASDPLRNAKNYCVIMNTLLRKAAEQGGVHPVYIDKMSSDFALKIETMNSISQNTALMREMFRSYCRLVRKHSIQSYSLAVQKTMLLIDSDLSADLSLSSLSKQQNISSAYLSSLFKKETGKTVSEYIREKRVQYAANLLSTTHLQIQTIALHCGIMDVQYFSKLFKKQMGKTPKEYRESTRGKF